MRATAVDAKVTVARGGREIMAARQELWPRRAEHHDGGAAHLLDERAQRAHAVGPRAVDVFEDQQQGRALRVDFEEASQHGKRHELKGLRVFVDGLGERRGARAEPQVRAEEVQDLVDAPVAEEVHHLGAHLVGLRDELHELYLLLHVGRVALA